MILRCKQIIQIHETVIIYLQRKLNNENIATQSSWSTSSSFCLQTKEEEKQLGAGGIADTSRCHWISEIGISSRQASRGGLEMLP